MNRQIVAFLSLFSLVLVLSVYYVMLPFAPQNSSNDENVNVDVKDASELYFATLADQKDDSFVAFIDDQTMIVASSTATSVEKAAALQAIEAKRALNQKESETVALLKNAGFDLAYVETATDGSVQIVLYQKEDPTKAEIAEALTIAIEQFGYEKLPQITFYEKAS